ncbi:SH3 domain-containing protein [Patescibacteria group bacterium]|nr:SH3 domain-containing protein [Patescibacteria group bacterium]
MALSSKPSAKIAEAKQLGKTTVYTVKSGSESLTRIARKYAKQFSENGQRVSTGRMRRLIIEANEGNPDLKKRAGRAVNGIKKLRVGASFWYTIYKGDRLKIPNFKSVVGIGRIQEKRVREVTKVKSKRDTFRTDVDSIPAAPNTTGTIVGASRVNFRPYPTIRCKRIGPVRINDKVQIVGMTKNRKWYEVRMITGGYQGVRKGFIYHKYVRPTKKLSSSGSDDSGEVNLVSYSPNRKRYAMRSSVAKRPKRLARVKRIRIIPAPENQWGRIVNSSRVNFRPSPTTNSKRIGPVRIRDTFQVIGSTPDGNWYKVRMNEGEFQGKEGFIYKRYVRVNE